MCQSCWHNTVSFFSFFFSLAVKSGDVDRFQEVLDEYSAQFRDDHTFTLILRLHHNVIKTAIRTISLAYSRISLHDVAKKLRLESAEDAEYIIAKVRHGEFNFAITVEPLLASTQPVSLA